MKLNKFFIKLLILFIITFSFYSCNKESNHTLPRRFSNTNSMKNTKWGKTAYYLQSMAVYDIEASGSELWFATDSGLQHIDMASGSYNLITESDGLPSNQINAITKTESDLWIATPNGISKYSDGIWENYNSPLKGIYTKITASKADTVWLGSTKGVASYSFGRWNIYNKNINVTQLIATSNNGVWVGTENSGIFKCVQGTCHKHIFSDLTHINALSNGQTTDELWISGTTSNGTAKFLYKKGSKIHTYHLSSEIKRMSFYKNSIYAYTGKKLLHLVFCDQANVIGMTKVKHSKGAPCLMSKVTNTNLPPNITFMATKNGYIWFGTGSMGAIKYNGNTIKYYSSEDLVNAKSKLFSLSCEISGKQCYLYAGKKAFVWNAKNGFSKLVLSDYPDWKPVFFTKDYADNPVAIISNINHEYKFLRKTAAGWSEIAKDFTIKSNLPEIIFGTFTKSYIMWLSLGTSDEPQKLYVINFKKKRFYPPRNYKNVSGRRVKIPKNAFIMKIFAGHRYIGTTKGLVHLWKKRKRKYIYIHSVADGLPSSIVTDMAYTKDNKLYVSTDMGLCLKEYEGAWQCAEQSPLPGSGAINSIIQLFDKNILYVASSNTIYKIHQSQVEQFDTEKELWDPFIIKMRYDNHGRLWIRHESGLSIIFLKNSSK